MRFRFPRIILHRLSCSPLENKSGLPADISVCGLFFSSVISSTDEISSFLSSDKRLIIGCHFAVLVASGISYAGSVNTLHLEVKNNKSL